MELLKKFKHYLADNSLSVAELARRIRYDRAYLSQIMHEKCSPGRKFIEEIEEFTNGKISRKDFPRKNMKSAKLK
jgi:transcriptional regulator with XRE-family HTH domain